MVTLLIQFPAGRYHATPFDHHVNEGQMEWPPSPWRLLRALLATGYNTLGWEAGLDEPWSSHPPDAARSLVLKLARQLPSYSLPTGVSTHSRHYMPTASFNKGREQTTLVFDTWARLDEGSLAVTWHVELTDVESALLAALAGRIGYLGRSESWIDARLAGPEDSVPYPNCVPEHELAPPGPGWEQVPVLAPLLPEDYERWRENAVATALQPLQSPEGKKPNKSQRNKQAKAVLPFPRDLIACLQVDTNWLRSHGWSQPPGSRRVFYWRPAELLEPSAQPPRAAARRAEPVECMLLSLATSSGNDHALPPVTRTLPQAEMLHRKLVGIANKISGYSRVLSGCDAGGAPLDGAHEHAHVVPLDLDDDGHIEHILIWAPMGLDHDAQKAIRAARTTHTKGGVGELKLALEMAGALDDLRRLPSSLGRRIGALLGPEGGAREWISWTPFVAPRHVKPRGRNTLEGQIQAELAVRGYGLSVQHEAPRRSRSPTGDQRPAAGESDPDVRPATADPELKRLRHFVRVRRNGPAPAVDAGHLLRLHFAEPVRGPLCLGYASHFGLGLFRANPAAGPWRA